MPVSAQMESATVPATDTFGFSFVCFGVKIVP